MQNPFHASYWTYPDQFSARNHQRAPIHPVQSSSLPTSSWAIKNQQNSLTLLSRLKFTEFRAFSHQLTLVRMETKLWANCQDFLQKLNPIRAESQPELGLKKEIKIQRRQILHLHWGLLALENAANVTGSSCRNIISKNPNSIYAVSHLKYFLAWDKRLFLLLIKTDHEINLRTSVCQKWRWDRWKNPHCMTYRI